MEVTVADAEFLAWQKQELEPQDDGMRTEQEDLQQQVVIAFPLTASFIVCCESRSRNQDWSAMKSRPDLSQTRRR